MRLLLTLFSGGTSAYAIYGPRPGSSQTALRPGSSEMRRSLSAAGLAMISPSRVPVSRSVTNGVSFAAPVRRTGRDQNLFESKNEDAFYFIWNERSWNTDISLFLDPMKRFKPGKLFLEGDLVRTSQLGTDTGLSIVRRVQKNSDGEDHLVLYRDSTKLGTVDESSAVKQYPFMDYAETLLDFADEEVIKKSQFLTNSVSHQTQLVPMLPLAALDWNVGLWKIVAENMRFHSTNKHEMEGIFGSLETHLGLCAWYMKEQWDHWAVSGLKWDDTKEEEWDR